MRLQALRADLLHHALHRRIDRADRAVRRLEERRQHAVTRAAHGRHHPVRADGDDAVAGGERNRPARPARRSRRRCIACTMLPTNVRSCGRSARSPGASSQHQTTTSAAASMSVDLVAVDHLLVAGEVQHLRAGAAKRLADREQHRVAEAAADEHDGFARLDLRRRAGRSHQHDRLARLQRRAQVGRAAHLEHDRRDESLARGRPTRRSARDLPSRAGCPRDCAPAPRSSAGDRTGRARSAAPRRARARHLDDRRRQPCDALDGGAQRVVELREELRVGRARRRRDLRQACATRSGSPASRSPSP